MVKVGRGKRRYLLFHLTAEKSFQPEAGEVWKVIYKAYRRLFGLTGLSQAELAWIDYKGNLGFGILRCNYRAVARLRTALAMVDGVNGRRIRICTVRVSGTIKTLKETLRKMEG